MPNLLIGKNSKIEQEQLKFTRKRMLKSRKDLFLENFSKHHDKLADG